MVFLVFLMPLLLLPLMLPLLHSLYHLLPKYLYHSEVEFCLKSRQGLNIFLLLFRLHLRQYHKCNPLTNFQYLALLLQYLQLQVFLLRLLLFLYNYSLIFHFQTTSRQYMQLALHHFYHIQTLPIYQKLLFLPIPQQHFQLRLQQKHLRHFEFVFCLMFHHYSNIPILQLHFLK